MRERAEGFRCDGDMAHAARFQTFEVLNCRVEELPVAVGHGVIVASAGGSAIRHRSLPPKPVIFLNVLVDFCAGLFIVR